DIGHPPIAELLVKHALPAQQAGSRPARRGDELALKRRGDRRCAILSPGAPLGALPARGLIGARKAGGRLLKAAPAVGIKTLSCAGRTLVGSPGLQHLDIGLGQLIDKPRRRGALPQAAVAPVLREADHNLLACPCDADVGEPPLLLKTGRAIFIKAPLMREQTFLPAGQEDDIKLQPLGGVQRHYANALVAV